MVRNEYKEMLACNSINYVKALYDRAVIKEQLCREEGLRTQKEEIKAYENIVKNKNNEELLQLVDLYGDAVRKNTLSVAMLNEAHLDLADKQKALDIATRGIREIFID